jgi:hypothetical protein
MNKIEVYNSVVRITRESGQGLSGRILRFKSSEFGDFLDELIEEGKLDSYVESFSYMPNEEWIVPKGCYNSIKDDREGANGALTFIRMYLNREDLGLNTKISDVITKPDFMKRYSEWLTKNEKALIDLVNMKEIEYTPDELKENEIKWIKTRGWYSDNLSVFECYEKSSNSSSIKNDSDLIGKLTEIIKLCKDIPKYKDDVEKHKLELKEMNSGVKIRKNVNNWLQSQKQDEKIQNIVK